MNENYCVVLHPSLYEGLQREVPHNKKWNKLRKQEWKRSVGLLPPRKEAVVGEIGRMSYFKCGYQE